MLLERAAGVQHSLDKPIQDLVHYADSHDAGERASLYARLIDLFVSDNAPTKDPLRAQLLDVIQGLIPRVDEATRAAAIETLVQKDLPPVDVVKIVVQDRATLVHDLLLSAPFSEDDILSIIKYTTREHHQILADRGDLSANVWIALARAAPKLLSHAEAKVTQQRRRRQGTDSMANWAPEADQPAQTQAGAEAPSPQVGDPSKSAKTLNKAHLRVLSPEPSHPEEPVGTPDAQNSDMPGPQASAARDDDTVADVTTDGWSFESDRDGFLQTLSAQGQALFGGGRQMIGQPLLDVLGLNAKLGHPIARALQRRSPIHSAPLFIPLLPRGQRYWTLDATPRFNETSGAFDGYAASLSPVMSGEQGLGDDDDDEPSDHSDHITEPFDSPIGDQNNEPQVGSPPASLAPRQPGVGAPSHSAELDEDDLAIGLQARPGDSEFTPIEEALDAVARSMVADMVEESVRDALGQVQEQGQGEGLQPTSAQGSAYHGTSPAPSVGVARPASGHMSAADELLDLLSENMEKMAEAAENGDQLRVQLYRDIARACEKALRSALN